MSPDDSGYSMDSSPGPTPLHLPARHAIIGLVAIVVALVIARLIALIQLPGKLQAAHASAGDHQATKLKARPHARACAAVCAQPVGMERTPWASRS